MTNAQVNAIDPFLAESQADLKHFASDPPPVNWERLALISSRRVYTRGVYAHYTTAEEFVRQSPRLPAVLRRPLASYRDEELRDLYASTVEEDAELGEEGIAEFGRTLSRVDDE